MEGKVAARRTSRAHLVKDPHIVRARHRVWIDAHPHRRVHTMRPSVSEGVRNSSRRRSSHREGWRRGRREVVVVGGQLASARSRPLHPSDAFLRRGRAAFASFFLRTEQRMLIWYTFYSPSRARRRTIRLKGTERKREGRVTPVSSVCTEHGRRRPHSRHSLAHRAGHTFGTRALHGRSEALRGEARGRGTGAGRKEGGKRTNRVSMISHTH